MGANVAQVLHVAEQLHAVSARFDRCRAQRYQQLCDASNQERKLAAAADALAAGGGSRGGAAASSSPQAAAGGLLPGSKSAALLKAAKLGGAVFTQFKGATQALLQGGPGGVGPTSPDAASSQLMPWEPQQQQQPAQQHSVQQQMQLQAENQDLVVSGPLYWHVTHPPIHLLIMMLHAFD